MICRIGIKFDALDWLEGETISNPDFTLDDWTPGDIDRLKKIVEFLEYQEREARVISQLQQVVK